jgi:hypothetical protein
MMQVVKRYLEFRFGQENGEIVVVLTFKIDNEGDGMLRVRRGCVMDWEVESRRPTQCAESFVWPPQPPTLFSLHNQFNCNGESLKKFN